MPRVLAIGGFAVASMLASAYGWAGDLVEWPANRLLAGEIIVAPQTGSSKAPSKATSAAEQRDRARSYRDDVPSDSTTVIVLPEEEVEGALSPRGNAPEGRARDNRSRAMDYQHGTDSSVLPNFIRPDAGTRLDGGSTQDRAHENRSRAGAYSRGDGQAGLTGRVGADGLPVVVCKDRDNVAGQIGDDLKSGSVIVILRDGKQVKVRCQ